MKKSLATKLSIYKDDLETKGLYWSFIHRVFKIPYGKQLLLPFVNFLKPSSVEIQKQTMFIDKSDQVVSQALLLYKTWEPFQTQVFLEQCAKNNFVIDIGAHIGYYTLLAASEVGAKGSVYAFEPDPKNFNLLQKNIKVNGYTNVILEKAAISNVSKTSQLYTDTQNSGDHRLYDSGEQRSSIAVKTVTLDDFFQKHVFAIDLIKVDIQGNEYNALLGAEKILSHAKNLKIITEFYPKGLLLAGASAEKYLKLLSKYGFVFFEISEKEKKLTKITAKKLLQKYRETTEDFTNLLCIRNHRSNLKR